MARLWVWGSGWVETRRARREGVVDGTLLIPRADCEADEFPQYERTIHQRAEQINSAFKQRWLALDGEMHAAYCNAKGDYARALVDIDRLSKSKEEIQREYEEAKKKVDQSGGAWYLNKTAYFAILLVLDDVARSACVVA